MDERQIDALAEKIFLMLRNELKQETVGVHPQSEKQSKPKAYIILPEQIRQVEIARTLECLNSCQNRYRRVVVIPDKVTDLDESIKRRTDQILERSKASVKEDDSVTIFVSASRNLRVKVALCLGEDFESQWVINCIENGRPIYMWKEETGFTGKEPVPYRRKLQEYDHELKTFGILFNCLPSEEREEIQMKPSVSARATAGKRIFTAEDINAMPSHTRLELNRKDIITELGREAAQEKGIEIITC
ncbi:MAG: hypothetical protein HFE76_11150 [Firmicutes bacterium]|nr:hypothetical protein [Bacillota bacterium]